jgi:hypothetical protein
MFNGTEGGVPGYGFLFRFIVFVCDGRIPLAGAIHINTGICPEKEI